MKTLKIKYCRTKDNTIGCIEKLGRLVLYNSVRKWRSRLVFKGLTVNSRAPKDRSGDILISKRGKSFVYYAQRKEDGRYVGVSVYNRFVQCG